MAFAAACSGVPYDMQQRNTVAEVINAGLGINVTAKDVIVVSAMEATGVAYAVQRYVAGRMLAHLFETAVVLEPYIQMVALSRCAGTP